jgi:hypothetical protein
MRYGLTTAALADAYFYFEQAGTAHQLDYHYDEFEAELGYPMGPPSAIRPSVYVRYFDNGAVIVNGTGAPQTVTASDLQGGPYYRFQGGQVPAFNNGRVVTDADPILLVGTGALTTWAARPATASCSFGRRPRSSPTSSSTTSPAT